MEIKHYISQDGKNIYQEWLNSLRDKIAKATVVRRIDRIEMHGNFGDCKKLRGGISELKIDIGAGYRIYYTEIGKVVLLLLCGGNKTTQSEDIKKAISYLEDFKKRGGTDYE